MLCIHSLKLTQRDLAIKMLHILDVWKVHNICLVLFEFLWHLNGFIVYAMLEIFSAMCFIAILVIVIEFEFEVYLRYLSFAFYYSSEFKTPSF